jgi:hypothetical protein|uniref:Uncharacterized protein n=1 Tax=Zea mays TaxID=4577 RepID=A0A804PSS3_MAIZE
MSNFRMQKMGYKAFDLNVFHDVDDEVDDALNERNEDVLKGRANTLSRDEESGQQISIASRNKQEKELKKLRKSDNIENMMGRYLKMRSKQVEYESAREKEARENEAREMEVTQSDDFSIKRCISVMNTIEEVTKLEKAKAYSIFAKTKENRETFICACEADQESALIWLRNGMS